MILSNIMSTYVGRKLLHCHVVRYVYIILWSWLYVVWRGSVQCYADKQFAVLVFKIRGYFLYWFVTGILVYCEFSNYGVTSESFWIWYMVIFVTDIVEFVCCLRIINAERFGGGIWIRFLRRNWSFVKCHLRRLRVVNQTWARRVAEDSYCGTKRTVTKENLAESFRVTQRLAVWCCANSDSLSPETLVRTYQTTRRHNT